MDSDKYYCMSIDDRLYYLEAKVEELLKLFWVSDEMEMASITSNHRRYPAKKQSRLAYPIVKELMEVMNGSSS